MKLRNKKTGEIGNFCYGYTNELCVSWQEDDGFWGKQGYASLAELNEEWEDYEEPKELERYSIDTFGNILPTNDVPNFSLWKLRQIGNTFETKKEAEEAVEKLKAWKRLKDKGFRFNGGDDACISYLLDPTKWGDELEKDFDLLFGGEE